MAWILYTCVNGSILSWQPHQKTCVLDIMLKQLKAYLNGLEDGKEEAAQERYDAGYDDGYQSGKTDGYDLGYRRGLADAIACEDKLTQ